MQEIQARELTKAWEKMRGLLGTEKGERAAAPVLLERCNSIHTFSMHYPIDVAFIDRANKVVQVQKALGAGQLSKASRACRTLERPSSEEPWPIEGQQVVIERVQNKTGRIAYVRF